MYSSQGFPCGMCDKRYSFLHEMYRCRHEHLAGKPQLLESGKWTQPFGAWTPKQQVGGIDYV